jgi:hypothetical protein
VFLVCKENSYVQALWLFGQTQSNHMRGSQLDKIDPLQNHGVNTWWHFIPVGRCQMHSDAHQGLIPFCLHLDGAEMFTNNEFMVWSIQSVFANGTDVWDSKFPVCFIPLESMRDQDVRDAVHQTIAEIVAWSLKAAATGVWPTVGPKGENLIGGDRGRLQGQQLAGGFRACYWGFRADGKARKEVHGFQRSYLHSFVCESCMAQRPHKGWQPQLNYKNFYPRAAHRLSKISPFLSC